MIALLEGRVPFLKGQPQGLPLQSGKLYSPRFIDWGEASGFTDFTYQNRLLNDRTDIGINGDLILDVQPDLHIAWTAVAVE